MAPEGKGLVRVDGLVVFVEGAVPGDLADIEITTAKKDFAMGRVAQLISPSPERSEPFCDHFGICGGCRWQHVAYEAQLRFKQHIVAEAFRRIGKIDPLPVQPIVACDHPTAYRNKLEFTFTASRWLSGAEIASGVELSRNGLGFHMTGDYQRVLDIHRCWLMEEYVNTIRNTIRDTAKEMGLAFFNLKTQEGSLRTLIIRNSPNGQWMVVVVFAHEILQPELFMNLLVQRLERVTSWHYVINPKGNDKILDLPVIHHHGAPFITVDMDGLTFRIGPKSFFQTNTLQALKLYRLIRDRAMLTGEETVWDLYCGTGTIALFLAKQCKEVIGIEVVPEAIQDAETNAGINNAGNVRFICANLDELHDEGVSPPDLVVVDPPRAGLHPRLVRQLNDIAATRLIYVSCNPATQARDVALMTNYRLVECHPIDMFPQTHHVENVAVLERIGATSPGG